MQISLTLLLLSLYFISARCSVYSTVQDFWVNDVAAGAAQLLAADASAQTASAQLAGTQPPLARKKLANDKRRYVERKYIERRYVDGPNTFEAKPILPGVAPSNASSTEPVVADQPAVVAVTCDPLDQPQGTLGPVFLVNAGGPELCGLSADQGSQQVGGGGTTTTYTTGTCASCATNPTWDCRTCTVRIGTTSSPIISYTTSNLTAGNRYIVRLTLAEPDLPTPGKRQFVVVINGIMESGIVDPGELLSQQQPLVKSYSVVAGDTEMTVVLKAVVDYPNLASLEVYDMGPPTQCTTPVPLPTETAVPVARVNAGAHQLCGLTPDADQPNVQVVSGGTAVTYYNSAAQCSKCTTALDLDCRTCSIRTGSQLNYSRSNLIVGNRYIARLVFTETDAAIKPGQRQISVSINGMLQPHNIDPAAASNSPLFKPLQKDYGFIATAANLDIVLKSVANSVILASLEVYDLGPARCHPPTPPKGAVKSLGLINAGGPELCGLAPDAQVHPAGVGGNAVTNTTHPSCQSCQLDPVFGCAVCDYRTGPEIIYTLQNALAKKYTVRLTFTEPTFTVKGQRSIRVYINGVLQPGAVDPAELSGGKLLTPVVKDYNVVGTSPELTIRLTSEYNDVVIATVEVYDMGPATPTTCANPPRKPEHSVNTVLLVNSGGPAICGFQADDKTPIAMSGEAITFYDQPQCASCTLNPAINCTACTVRKGEQFTYKVPNPIKGNTYLIRPTFTRTTRNPAKNRLINLNVNGAPVLQNFDPYSHGGELFVPMTLDVNHKATGDTLMITLEGAYKGVAVLAALQVYDLGPSRCTGPPDPPNGAVSTVRLINAGGPAICGYSSDTNLDPAGYGGTAKSYYGVPDTPCATCYRIPTQACIGCTVRIGDVISYKIPGLTAGNSYVVRLTFIEPYWVVPGQRLFNVHINGVTLLSDVDVYKWAGNKKFAPVIKEIRATQMTTTMNVTLESTVDQALLAALEVYDMGPAGCMGPPAPPAGAKKTIKLVNAGGPGFCGFSPDTDAAPAGWGGQAQSWYGIPNNCDTCRTNPSLSCLACTVRWGKEFSYKISNLHKCNVYIVRLTFADVWWTEGENRLQDALINGKTVLAGIDSLALSGGRLLPVTKEVQVVQESRQMILTLRSEQEYAVLAAYEVYDMGPGQCPEPEPLPEPDDDKHHPELSLPFTGDTSGKLTRDIRGLFLDLDEQPLLIVSRDLEDPRRPPTAFTYSTSLYCTWTGCEESVGRCDMAASVLPCHDDTPFTRQAILIARCELTPTARECDPQLKYGQIILGQGQVDVVLEQDTRTNWLNIRSFAGDALVDNVYRLGRPDTVLGGVIGFKRGNMRFDVRTDDTPITRDSEYEGRLTLSLYKGPF